MQEVPAVQTPVETLAGLDAVEVALARAIAEATNAHQWDVVGQLARELEARRLARSTNVIALDAAKRRSK